jgi:hypothetical protein
MTVWNFFCKGFAYLNPDDLQNLVEGKGSWPASLHLCQAGPIVLSKKQIKKLQKSHTVGMAHMNFDTKFSLIRVLMQQAGPRKTWRIVATTDNRGSNRSSYFCKICVLERISSTWTGTVFIMTSRIQEEGDSHIISAGIDLQLHISLHSHSLDFWCDW